MCCRRVGSGAIGSSIVARSNVNTTLLLHATPPSTRTIPLSNSLNASRQHIRISPKFTWIVSISSLFPCLSIFSSLSPLFSLSLRRFILFLFAIIESSPRHRPRITGGYLEDAASGGVAERRRRRHVSFPRARSLVVARIRVRGESGNRYAPPESRCGCDGNKEKRERRS